MTDQLKSIEDVYDPLPDSPNVDASGEPLGGMRIPVIGRIDYLFLVRYVPGAPAEPIPPDDASLREIEGGAATYLLGIAKSHPDEQWYVGEEMPEIAKARGDVGLYAVEGGELIPQWETGDEGDTCPDCSGTGEVDLSVGPSCVVQCERCEGTGTV